MTLPAIEAIDAEAAPRVLQGTTARVAAVLAIALSLYALYWVVGIVPPQVYRVSFLLIALVLTFLCYPAVASHRRSRTAATLGDWLLAALSIVALAWPLIDLDQFIYRAASPVTTDLVLGILTVLLVLEATRRTVCLLYTSPSPRDQRGSRMPSSA